MRWRLFSISVFLLSLLSCGFFLNANTYATRVEVDTNNLTGYFSSSPYSTITSDIITSLATSSAVGNIQASVNDSTLSSLSCSSSDHIYSYVIYGDKMSSNFVPFSIGNNIYVSGSFNSGIVYYWNRPYTDKVAVIGTSSVSFSKNQNFNVLTLGCSEEEVAPQSTPTPTPEETPTSTPEETPTPTPIEPSATVDPNDYEYNQMEDTAIRYSFYAFCIICLSVFLIYEIIIKRIIQK